MENKSQSSIKSRVLLYCKGLAMGMADSVPGVSGATIAVITNIYEELLNSIKSVNPLALSVLWKDGFPAFWLVINGTFLLTLLIGVFTSLIFAANIVPFLLANYFSFIMAFFVGLVLASCHYLQKEVHSWRVAEILIALGGLVFVVVITLFTPADADVSLGYLFFCGLVAICAFILPGLSGSFVLLMLGVYDYVLSALAAFEIVPILVFASGCVLGLVSFSHILSLMLKMFRQKMFAFLTGMLLGSLYLLWPWKQVLSYRTNSHGEEIPLQRINVGPGQYEMISGNSADIAFVLLLALAGFMLIVCCQKLSNRISDISANEKNN